MQEGAARKRALAEGWEDKCPSECGRARRACTPGLACLISILRRGCGAGCIGKAAASEAFVYRIEIIDPLDS